MPYIKPDETELLVDAYGCNAVVYNNEGVLLTDNC